jgi:hypothetical protein
MGEIRNPAKVMLIAGMLSGDPPLFAKAKALLERRLRNKAVCESAIFDFTHTDYYRAEMGPGLKRQFLAFGRHLPLDGISRVKLATNSIEKLLSRSGTRLVNIDPGYVDLSKVVLFSTKDYTHRVYLGNGIFAENTLFYKDGAFHPWPWTYPDYKTAEYLDFFGQVRTLCRAGRGT